MNCVSNGTVYEEAVGREGSWARLCDGCCAVPSVVYCRADSAYLCASCDAQIHAANRVASRHERVLLSEAYKHAPVVLECHADAAALCAAYEAQVHYTNLLAAMHQRVPVVSHPAAAIPAASLFAEAAATPPVLGRKEEDASWLLLSKDSDNHNHSGNNSSSSSTSRYFGEVDQYFDLVGYNSYYDSRMSNQEQYVMQEQQHLQQMQKEYAEQQMQKEYVEKEGSECIVPSQSAIVSRPHQSGYAPLVGAEQAASVTAGISFSMEAGIVPDNTVQSSILRPAGAIGLFSSPSLQTPLHLSSKEREARVLRYKEKKKSRKFEKTTRYATRKAYAEARPRIKGRFAKRSDAEMEVDQTFSTAALSDSSYSTVPWF
ncbi:zinc finger protein HD1-like isoform X2 [Triticum dicoccoides]|uniref:zinc finger protein HD1-like isoform X2 n=1 Tax=Triticum dicoccoides TaxID=85692 RepID=UPI001891DE4F|nr:zinc finger protein HD1-like isoform X2 [Triticum dicoccoides]